MSVPPTACSSRATCAASRFSRSSAAITPASAVPPPWALPPPHAERIWANLTACKYMLLDAIKPGGVEPRDLRALSRQGRRARTAADFLHRPRHRSASARGSLPRPEPTKTRALEAGMVLGIEPLIYETRFRLRDAEQGYGSSHAQRMRVVVGLSRYRQASRRGVELFRPAALYRHHLSCSSARGGRYSGR